MRPLAEFPLAARAGIRAVLTDIDDTLTDEGRLPAKAYEALEALKEAGLLVIPVTGRPGGWCDLIARQWPVDAVVGENGALAFRYDDKTRKMTRLYAKTAAERAADRARLAAIEAEVLASVPGAATAADQAYREADLAIDFCEDVPPLPREAIQKIVTVFEKHGAVAKVSSIHVNGWFGSYDKLSMSARVLADLFGLSVESANAEIAYAGDSPNDAPMFGFFTHSVGVANVKDFAGQLTAEPKWVTPGRGASGFAELAAALLAARGR